MTLSLATQREQNVCAGSIMSVRRNCGRSPNHPVKSWSSLWCPGFVINQRSKFYIQKCGECISQLLQVCSRRLQQRCGVGVIGQRQQQVFQRRMLVSPLAGNR
jgi:hypothetical protein